MRGLLRATTSDVNTIGLTQSDQALLPQFVQAAKQNVGPFFFCFSVNLQNDRASIPYCPSEVGQVQHTSPRPLPLRQIVLLLLRQSLIPSRSTAWMELNSSTLAFEPFESPACSS